MNEGTFDRVFGVAWRSLDPDNVNKGNDWVKQLYFRAHIRAPFYYGYKYAVLGACQKHRVRTQ